MAPRKARYEGSALDERRDKAQAKKRGVSMAQWERSAADKRMDKAGQKALDKKRKKPTRAAAKAKNSRKTAVKAKAKMDLTMHEFGAGKLHSGSKRGPKVTSRKQAVAIGLSQARRASRGR